MDISQIIPEIANTKVGIVIGQDTAPIKIIEFINLRCPYCTIWHNDSQAILKEYTNAGKVQQIVKLFDKQKPSLDKGNVMHRYVPKNDGAAALDAIADIFKTQGTWGDLETFEDVARYAEDVLGLEKHQDLDMSRTIVDEATKSFIQFVPTMVIGKHVFDQNISQEELKHLLDGNILPKYIK